MSKPRLPDARAHSWAQLCAGWMCRYLGDGSGGHFDALLKQQTQYTVLLLQVKHARAQFHTFLF